MNTKSITHLLLVCMAWFCVINADRISAAEIEKTIVFESGKDGYHTYRIPAVIRTKTGTLLAFCEGRKNGRGDSGDIDLLVKRSHDQGKTWSKAVIVWDDAENTCGNPCPVIDQATGRIHLPLTWNLGTDHGGTLHTGNSKDTRRVFYCDSDDDGKTWTKPVEITKQTKQPAWWWYATGPGIGIQLTKGKHKGRLVIPCDHTAPGYLNGSHVIYSDDAGQTWEISSPIRQLCNESQVVELSDGRLMINMRSQPVRKGYPEITRKHNGYRSIAFSSDGGETWTEAEDDPHLGEPICQASLMRYDAGRLLFSNPSPPIKPGSGPRIRMTVRVSTDDGKTWPKQLLIHRGPAAYSCLTPLDGNQVGIIYEAGKKSAYETITFARFDIDEMKAE